MVETGVLQVTPKRAALIVTGLAVIAVVVGLYAPLDPAESVASVSAKWEGSTHAAAEAGSFTYWDDDEPAVIPVGCAKCHSTYGYRDFLGEDGSNPQTVDSAAATGTTVYCIACHNPSAHAMERVEFPSGAEIGDLGPEAVCMQCHQGLRAGTEVRRLIAGRDEDTVDSGLSFVNAHYYLAAASWLGTEAGGGFEYDGRTYAGRFEHVPDLQRCAHCHDPHSQRVTWQTCSPCHVTVAGPSDLWKIRVAGDDYDGDGDTEEGLAEEIATMQSMLLDAIQSYASGVAGSPVAYVNRFPYFLHDANGNGAPDAAEISGGNRYAYWTPRLLRAAFNYHFSLQDRGNYAHNGRYVLQLLYDSLDDLGQRAEVEFGEIRRPSAK